MSTSEDMHDFEVSCNDCLEKKYHHDDVPKNDNHSEDCSNNSLPLNNDGTCCNNDFNKHNDSCDDLLDNHSENCSDNSLSLNNDDTCCSDDFFNDLCNLCCNNICGCNNIFIIRHHKKKRKFSC